MVEIALPMFVILILVYLHSKFKITVTPASLHLEHAYNFTKIADATEKNLPTNLMPYLQISLNVIKGKIALVPEDELTDVSDYLIQANFGKHILGFKSDQELDDHVAQRNYGQDTYPLIHAAIVKTSPPDDPYKFDYTLRLNSSFNILEIPYQGTFDTKLPTIRTVQVGYEDKESEIYMKRGFMELEQMLSILALHKTKTIDFGVPESTSLTPFHVEATDFQFSYFPFPTPEFSTDDFSKLVGGYLGILFTITFMWPITRIVSGIVEEKELRIKEGMKMMGLRDTPLVLSWAITHLVMFIFTCILIVVVAGVSIFKNSSILLVYIYFYAFCLAIYGFAYLMSAIFDRARVASTFSSIIFLAAFFLIYAVEGPGVSRETKRLACLSPAVCLALGATTISKLESSQIGVNFNTLTSVIDNFAFSDAITMLLFDGVVLFLLGLYLEQVVPSQYGLRRPWYFLCSRSFWAGSKKAVDDETSESSLLGANNITALNEFYTKTEAPDHSLDGTELIRIRNLRKLFPLEAAVSSESVFTRLIHTITCRKSKVNEDDDNHDDQLNGGNFVAVKDLSLDMYKDQIFTLLGHNGAGKTTTINMLTGLYSPSEGNARVLDYNITSGMETIRHNMGVCPQHDILYPYLTVREHLELYAELKNVNIKTRNIEIDEMIDAVGLGIDGDNKANALAGSLSGGQMRKLSVGIALLGGSRVVYLDEPSSGMDVASQRHIWDLLMKAKKDRVIVLTTHFMEEAEIGDRIAIMAGGKLQCVGSSLFLKNSYGVGYSLTISKDTQNKFIDPKTISNFMAERYPFAELLSDAGGEISFRVPFSSSTHFAEMFDTFELEKKNLGLTTYGVSVTTLTEVFLKVGHGYVEEHADDDNNNNFGGVEIENHASLNSSSTTAFSSVTAAAYLAADKLKNEKLKKAARDEDEAADMYAGIDPEKQQVFGFNRIKLHTKALFMKRWHNAKRDKSQWMWQVLYPGIILSLSLMAQNAQMDPKFPTRPMSPFNHPEPNTISYPNLPTFPNTDYVMKNIKATDYGFTPLPITEDKFITDYTVGDKMTPWTFSNYLAIKPGEQPSTRYNAVAFSELEGLPMFEQGADVLPKVHAHIYFNTSSTESLPIGLNTAVNALLQANHLKFGPQDKPAPRVNILNHPLDRTNSELVITSAAAATSIALAFSFVPATFASFIVKERQDKGKHLQLISGVSPLSYWLSTFIWDLVNYIAPFFMGVGLLILFNIQAALGDAFIVTVINFWLFCISVAPFVYCLTFFFESHSAAQNMTLMLNFFLSVMLILVCIVMDLTDSTKGFNKYLRFVYRLLPPFAFVEVFVNVFVSDANAIYTKKFPAYSFEVGGWPLLYQVFDFVLYTVLLFVLEHYSSSASEGTSILSLIFPSYGKKKSEGIIDNYLPVEDMYSNDPCEDGDVADERLRIQGGMCNDSTVVIAGLGKTYPGRMGRPSFTAVHNLYYSVEAGECFGFLGANGAGKTTTIKMLTGDESPSKGTARLGGKDIIEEPYEVRQLIGYCPQFDALIALMTGREHLEMYARIKCVPEETIPIFVQRMLVKLSLDHLADRPAGTYSGGNKRKLSVGIALIGNPMIVFLDEPSTGMDPQARRSMWKLISSTMVGRSVILTTHSMEECEALCNRIGIMTKGKLRCLGNSQHLKSKFGQGYKLIVKATDDHVDSVTNYILNRFPGSERFEAHGTNLKFKVPKMNLTLSEIFRSLEQDKVQHGIATYSVSDTDLEQIFVNFVKEAEYEIPPETSAIPVYY